MNCYASKQQQQIEINVILWNEYRMLFQRFSTEKLYMKMEMLVKLAHVLKVQFFECWVLVYQKAKNEVTAIEINGWKKLKQNKMEKKDT